MDNKNDDFYVVTEIGTFDSLDIKDPTKKKVKRTELDSIINEAIEINRKNLTEGDE